MNIEAVNNPTGGSSPLFLAADKVSNARKQKDESPQDAQDAKKANQVQPEELLKQIKSLAQDGLYSVLFENDEKSNVLVVKIVDRETEEVIRQVPAEEVLAMRAALDDLRGNMVDTQG
ncbi:MAG: flagellar protein FlaG [Geopsychrobacter sp.]|nr:flagellar protein FlaG [Geopsychrobacter sp.]